MKTGVAIVVVSFLVGSPIYMILYFMSTSLVTFGTLWPSSAPTTAGDLTVLDLVTLCYLAFGVPVLFGGIIAAIYFYFRKRLPLWVPFLIATLPALRNIFIGTKFYLLAEPRAAANPIVILPFIYAVVVWTVALCTWFLVRVSVLKSAT